MKKTSVFFIGLLLLLSSCVGNSGSTENKNTNWRTGTDGIRFNFVTDNPPSEIVSTQQLSTIVEYSNKGAYDVKDLRFYLTGYDPYVFIDWGALGASNLLSAEGKSQFSPDGSQSYFVTWKTRIRDLRDVDSFKQEISATACYSYQTIATPTICIDPKKYDLVAADKCNFDVQDLGSSQGGPIAVTEIKQKTTNDRVYLEIYFENKGSGLAFSSSSLDNCYNSVSIDDADTISSIRVYTPSTSFSCKPEGRIRLTNKRGYVLCDAPISGQSYFVTPLNVVVNYKYRQSISTTITVVNVNPT